MSLPYNVQQVFLLLISIASVAVPQLLLDRCYGHNILEVTRTSLVGMISMTMLSVTRTASFLPYVDFFLEVCVPTMICGVVKSSESHVGSQPLLERART